MKRKKSGAENANRNFLRLRYFYLAFFTLEALGGDIILLLSFFMLYMIARAVMINTFRRCTDTDEEGNILVCGALCVRILIATRNVPALNPWTETFWIIAGSAYIVAVFFFIRKPKDSEDIKGIGMLLVLFLVADCLLVLGYRCWATGWIWLFLFVILAILMAIYVPEFSLRIGKPLFTCIAIWLGIGLASLICQFHSHISAVMSAFGWEPVIAGIAVISGVFLTVRLCTAKRRKKFAY